MVQACDGLTPDSNWAPNSHSFPPTAAEWGSQSEERKQDKDSLVSEGGKKLVWKE